MRLHGEPMKPLCDILTLVIHSNKTKHHKRVLVNRLDGNDGIILCVSRESNGIAGMITTIHELRAYIGGRSLPLGNKAAR